MLDTVQHKPGPLPKFLECPQARLEGRSCPLAIGIQIPTASGHGGSMLLSWLMATSHLIALYLKIMHGGGKKLFLFVCPEFDTYQLSYPEF